MQVLHGLEVGLGSLASVQRLVSTALVEPVEQARHFVQQQKAQYVDETGWYEGEQQKWLWINATRDVSVFHLLGGRSRKDAQEVISQKAKGIITTDRYWSYNWLSARRRQICWAHLKRDFQALVDRGGASAKTGQALLQQVKRLFALWHHYTRVARRFPVRSLPPARCDYATDGRSTADRCGESAPAPRNEDQLLR